MAKVPLSYLIPDALKQELKKLADSDRRPLSQYVQIVLEEHVAAKKAAAPKRRG